MALCRQYVVPTRAGGALFPSSSADRSTIGNPMYCLDIEKGLAVLRRRGCQWEKEDQGDNAGGVEEEEG